MAYTITYDTDVTGYVAFRGPKEDGRKVAVIMTKHHQGVFKNGMVVYEAMPRSSWLIHFTAPQLHIELVEAVMASLPKEA